MTIRAREVEDPRDFSTEELLNQGFEKWENRGCKTLYLFPDSWYDKIPDDYSITNIFWEENKFEFRTTSDDTREGLLAFGIVKEISE